MPLAQNEIDQLLPQFPDWVYDTNTQRLQTSLLFRDFATTVSFIMDMADDSSELGHFPNVLWHGGNRLEISTTTPAENGLSRLDFDLAQMIDALWTRYANAQAALTTAPTTGLPTREQFQTQPAQPAVVAPPPAEQNVTPEGNFTYPPSAPIAPVTPVSPAAAVHIAPSTPILPPESVPAPEPTESLSPSPQPVGPVLPSQSPSASGYAFETNSSEPELPGILPTPPAPERGEAPMPAVPPTPAVQLESSSPATPILPPSESASEPAAIAYAATSVAEPAAAYPVSASSSTPDSDYPPLT